MINKKISATHSSHPPLAIIRFNGNMATVERMVLEDLGDDTTLAHLTNWVKRFLHTLDCEVNFCAPSNLPMYSWAKMTVIDRLKTASHNAQNLICTHRAKCMAKGRSYPGVTEVLDIEGLLTYPRSGYSEQPSTLQYRSERLTFLKGHGDHSFRAYASYVSAWDDIRSMIAQVDNAYHSFQQQVQDRPEFE